MLQLVDVGTQSIGPYSEAAGPEVIEELYRLAQPLHGARVAEINATPYGGGVSELLRSTVPLLNALGVAAEWKVIYGDEPFFNVTKSFHNALQGGQYDFPEKDRDIYLSYSDRNAHLLDEQYDYIVIHDPQPAAMRHFHGRGGAKWVWRCHIDTSQPNPSVWSFLREFVEEYDAAVFTMPQFVPADLHLGKVAIIPPAIDPLSPKNFSLPPELCRRTLDWIGVDVDKPLVTQVSRFDPWKDPLGVIESYRIVREYVPDLQLALVGSMALDDPEGWGIYRQILEYSREDPLVHVFTNLTGVGNVEVNAFQRVSEVIIQKSLREGFGLVVSESLWKGTPVVAGRTGGIPMQMPEGVGGFLVDSVKECAMRVLYLLQNPSEAQRLGRLGKEHVRQNFLLTRLLADELKLLTGI